ncbi:MAG TPA: nucleoside-diphosphate sugar epimerase/dehydratase [Alphaproteobacteria bacterium]|nr:nucleoside-diphosphate sugar epimerase/dehydratase [Alphaproteobacteria bacterium]
MPPLLRRLSRPTVAFAHDTVMAAAAFVLSLYLRLGDDFAFYSGEFVALGTLVFAAIAAAVYWWTGLHRGIWRYASLNDLLAITRAVTIIVLIFVPVMFLTTRLEQLPRSLVFIVWFVLVILLTAPRVLYRLLKDGHFDMTYDSTDERRVPVLLVGAGDQAEVFIQQSARRSRAQYRVLGILDDSETRLGRRIRGVEVLGAPDSLPQVVQRLDKRGLKVQRLIVARPDLTGPRLRALLEHADALGLSVARLPRLTELRAAESDRVEVRPIAIEDLLGRPQTVLDRTAMRELVHGRRVLVTGAGGTIGGELVRQIAELEPSRLVLIDNSEFNLYSIDLELDERAPNLSRRADLADVRDGARIERLLAEERPDLVFHAAALKHVPIVEAHPAEGALTNAVGTRNVAEACRMAGVKAMVLISTDKAVNPVNVMGATKRLAERYCQALDLVERARPGGTRFVTVRFGNVLGSTGSVVPLFQRQLAAGGPLTVTHREIKRYFMTVREAVELVLQASALGATDEAGTEGRIFVLDMGDPVRIYDLARQMIRLAGMRPDVDIKIDFTGLRPGEKLNEELFHAHETLAPTPVRGLLLASPRTADFAFLARGMDELDAAAREGHGATAAAILHRLVPEFRDAGAPAKSALQQGTAE